MSFRRSAALPPNPIYGMENGNTFHTHSHMQRGIYVNIYVHTKAYNHGGAETVKHHLKQIATCDQFIGNGKPV